MCVQLYISPSILKGYDKYEFVDLRIKCGFGNEVDRVEKIMIALKIFYGVVKNRGFLGFYYRSKHIVSVYLDLSWESSKIFLLSK